MAGDLNVKHVVWNSRLNTRRWKLLRDYPDGNSCLTFGPESQPPTHTTPLVNPDVLDNVINKNLSFPVYLTSCSALRSDHLPVFIDASCRSSFHNPPDRPDFRPTDCASFQAQLEELIPFDSELHNEMAIDTCVENFSGSVLKALAASTPKRRPLDNPRPSVPAGIKDYVRLKKRMWRQWQITRDPALKAEVNRLQMSVTRRLNEWRHDQWTATLESLDPEDQSLWKMTKRGTRVPTSSPPGHPRGNRSLRL